MHSYLTEILHEAAGHSSARLDASPAHTEVTYTQISRQICDAMQATPTGNALDGTVARRVQ